ncbi:MAG: hypothetical protein QN183_11815 [Armatimonadota bacterium]|nr:hypothetical protein [Armatimonadota bacterium]MDR7485076.1 hypothetical protein [Armatimonadota bacterium]MDR7537035.1 hypothetical protein [Armatimonadota bacterium]
MRQMGLWGSVLVVVLALAGGVPAGAQGDPPGADAPRPQDEPVVPGADLQGAPAVVVPRPGYAIWIDGDVVRVRWSGRGGVRVFSGAATAARGILDVRAVSLEPGDVLRRAGNTVAWTARARAGVDGFDLVVTRAAGWVRFALLIDGRLASRDEIVLGRGLAHPPGNPFVLGLGTGIGRDGWPPIVRGRPAAVPGPGYLIWLDDGEWQVRWVGAARETSGLVTTDGRFHDVRRERLEGGDQVARGAGVVAWATRGYDPDGVAFRTSGSRLTFTLLLDGALAAPSQIWLGERGVHPPRNPFTIGRSAVIY